MFVEGYVQQKSYFEVQKDDLGERSRFLAFVLLQMDLGNVDTRKMEVFVNM